MPPGEPVASSSDQEEDGEKCFAKSSKYHPAFQNSDWFVAPLINFDADSANMEEVYSAVRYWRDMALELKAQGYPIAEGIDNYRKFDTGVRQRARMLDDFLNTFITKRLYTDGDAFAVLRVLIAQGSPYLEFKEKMARVNFSLKCNTIWENDAVAYRCNTCAFTPCMSLCEACFDANGHEGHDYIRFFSREGGACDCGNQDVIREQGNCPDHGDESKRPKYDMSDVCLAEHIVTKLLVRLFLDYRGWMSRFQRAEQEYMSDVNIDVLRRYIFDLGSFTERDASCANKIIEFLQECSNYGGPMRMIVSEVLLNTNLYKSLTEKTGEHYDKSGRVELSLDWRTSHIFKDDRESVLLQERIAELFPLVNTISGTECFSLLDELIFWINRQLFPQNLINFGLSMLSEPGYRDAFAYRFFVWYPICGKMISDLCTSQVDHARSDDKVSPACSRVVHVTVQMLSSATLCKKLNEEVGLMKNVLDVTQYLICKILTDSHISLRTSNIFAQTRVDMDFNEDRGLWRVMTMRNNAAISQHGYWFVMGDIQNVLTHADLAVNSVLDDQCFGGSYMKMMCQMQGMNAIWRLITGSAQEIDGGEEVQKAYTLEFETLAVTLFNIVAAIQQENSVQGAIRFFEHVRANLEKWFQHLHPVKPEERIKVWSKIQRAQAYAVSFHIPLHRHISTALSHFTEIDGFYEYIQENLLLDEVLVRLLLIHPLRIQVARSEINCGMWVRNGAQARMSSLIYSQWNVSSAFQTPDIDLIRFCAAHTDREHFVRVLTNAFNINEKIRFRMGKLARLLPGAHELFDGDGKYAEEIEHQSTEHQIKKFEEFRKLIRENPMLIEDIMQNPSGDIAEGSSFGSSKREEVIELLCCSRNATQVIIEFNTPVAAIVFPPVQPIRRERNQNIVRRLIDASDDEDGDINDPPNIDAPQHPSETLLRQFENEDEPRVPVLLEPEWIDPMFWGMFKLVAELIVVRVNSGASSEEHYRSEMVNCMAMGNVPYSKLRGSISEKGSRGSEMIDKHFERILTEIGDFIEPVEAPAYLQQGSYQLKTSVWDSELCPVFFMMRSSSMKQAREVFSRMEVRERKNAMDKGEENGDVKMEATFWVPFRLISFDDKKRHRGISKIYTLLLTERFMLHCVSVLATGQDSVAKFHEATVQLAVYLLTLGVKYAQEYQGSEEFKQHLRDIYHTPFRLKKEFDLDNYNTMCSFMIKLLEDEVRKKDALLPIYRNILNGEYDKQKVIGGRMIYLARFVSILSKLSPTCRDIIQGKLTYEEIQLNKLAIQEESAKKIDPVRSAAKEAAKRRMAAIMQKTSQKNAQTMQKLMAKEGMTADEVETVDPSQQNRQVYECPICGEQDIPNTVEHPFGMLAKLSTNFLCEEQIDDSCQPVRELLEYDRVDDSEGILPQIDTRRNYIDKRRMGSTDNPQPEVAKVRAPLVGTDLKTCGHTAHIECFNAYRASLYDGRPRPADRREVGCPLCRFTVNTIVPMSFDKPYAPIKTPEGPLSFSDVWKVMNLLLKKAKSPVFQEDEKNVRYATLYSTREGGGLFEVWVGRQNSADWTERQSSFEKCTVSTLMISLAVAMVERSSLLRTLRVPERRKKARNALTEHIMIASVATSKAVDFDVTMSAMTSLFAKVSEPANQTPPSSERTSTSRESTPKPAEPVTGMSADEMAAMATKSSRKRSIDAESEVKMNVPLFILEPKSTLVRMIAVLIDNQSISKEMKQEIAQNMISAVIGWVSIYNLLCLLLRLGEQKMKDLSTESMRIDGFSDEMHDAAVSIAKALTSNQNFFGFMITKLATPEDELTDKDVCSTYKVAVADFIRFATELMYHCKLGTLEAVEAVHNENFNVVTSTAFDMSCLNPKGKANYWTLMYRNNLGWMSKLNKYFQPCISEPLAWKPRRILRPPRSFEELFTRYFHRECLNCTTSPANPVICLLCGHLLCLDDCCRVTHQEAGSDRVLSMSEVEAHAEQCSSSSGLFLSITSSMVLVMRGKQAAIWGTVYLDSHKEEDRNLKRGKPLYLCESRFKWLEYDWAEQEWQRVFQWINLSNSHAFINSIRECHLPPHH